MLTSAVLIAALCLGQSPSPGAQAIPADSNQDNATPVNWPADFATTGYAPYGYPPGTTPTSTTPSTASTPDEKATKTDSSAYGGDRRALPGPFASPPFPSSEYQGYPLIGVPVDTTRWPLMKAMQGTWLGDVLDSERIRTYGWINVSANVSNAKNSNTPDSYWIVPNSVQLDQLVFRMERQVDSVQTDHLDWGFRSTALFGTDYRYMTAGGWWPASDENLEHNFLYGVDFTEQYFDLYVPWVAQGMILRVGRWIACPDIETQFAPDNYMGTHSILFTFDTYTQTGVMATFMLNTQWTVQACINAGNDMAPWYKGAIPCGMFGVRWVSKDNNDSIYACLNQINNAEFRHFVEDGQPAGHDNFNYPVVTWQHRFNERIFTKTEAYFMWQRNAELGGTPSIGPLEPFGGGGGDGTLLPGLSLAYGTVNYTEFQLSAKDFISVRNEWWKDERGMRSGFPGTYTSHAIGLTHNFTPELQVRPEIGYYRNWTEPAFDLGTKQGLILAGVDVTIRF
jgi:Putative beta-barrel porin-2, OmpL-like. bbp2